LPEGAAVRVLSVLENAGPPPVEELMAGAGGDLKEYKRHRIAEHENLTKQVAASLARLGHSVETVVLEGKAADIIVKVAKEWPADLIVMGSHGYTGIERLLLGSVAESVVRHAPCSVEVVRDRDAAKE
jgi:nucleotide-binding universal stress UspA family protein